MGIISFAGDPPFELEVTQEPLARGVDGSVQMTLTVGVDLQDEFPISIWMSLAAAQSLYAKMNSAIRMAEVQAKGRS